MIHENPKQQRVTKRFLLRCKGIRLTNTKLWLLDSLQLEELVVILGRGGLDYDDSW